MLSLAATPPPLGLEQPSAIKDNDATIPIVIAIFIYSSSSGWSYKRTGGSFSPHPPDTYFHNVNSFSISFLGGQTAIFFRQGTFVVQGEEPACHGSLRFTEQRRTLLPPSWAAAKDGRNATPHVTEASPERSTPVDIFAPNQVS
jgi:hypothetical protein